MRIENDEGLNELLKSSEETQLCTGFGFTEGPLWVAADNALIFSDIPGNRMHRWRPGTSEGEVYRDPSGHSNGLTLDHAGNVLACEHSGRRVSRAPYDGAAESVVAAFEGKTLNSPNDLVVHSSGAIYFTDPNYGIPRPGQTRVLGDPDAVQQIDYQGVYRIAPDGTLTLLTDDLVMPNGLAFSPDESVLYIADSSERRVIRRFEVQSDGSIAGGEVFVDMSDDERRGVPDGMKLDEDGRIWSTGAGGVWVIEPDGHRLGVFETEEHAANLTFGGADFSTLFLTAATSLYSVETAVRGVVPGSR
jgi:gluconolactonase